MAAGGGTVGILVGTGPGVSFGGVVVVGVGVGDGTPGCAGGRGL
jgi:hypothetical protein